MTSPIMVNLFPHSRLKIGFFDRTSFKEPPCFSEKTEFYKEIKFVFIAKVWCLSHKCLPIFTTEKSKAITH